MSVYNHDDHSDGSHLDGCPSNISNPDSDNSFPDGQLEYYERYGIPAYNNRLDCRTIEEIENDLIARGVLDQPVSVWLYIWHPN